MGQHTVGTDLHARPAIWAGDEHPCEGIGAEIRKRPTISQDPDPQSRERPIGTGRDFHVELERLGWVGGEEVMASLEDQTDGASQSKGARSHDRLEDGPFASEGAAQRGRDHPDSIGRQAQDTTEILAQGKRPLRTRLDDQGSVVIDPGRAPLGFDVALVDPRRLELAAYGSGCDLECRFHIAGAIARSTDHIGRPSFLIDRIVAGAADRRMRLGIHRGLSPVGVEQVGADEYRVEVHGGAQVEDDRKRLEIDHHEFGRVGRLCLGLGDHHREGLAGEDDLVLRQGDRQAIRSGFQAKIAEDKDGHDAGSPSRRVRFDRGDARMRVRCQHEAGMESSEPRAVGDIAHRAGDLDPRIRPGASHAHAVDRVHASVSGPVRDAAASTVAAMIDGRPRRNAEPGIARPPAG